MIKRSPIIYIALVLTLIIQGYLMIKWVGIWGFWGSMAHWFETFSDPISAAAGIDLICLAFFVGMAMLVREGGWNKTISVILLPYILFPSIGFLLYLIISDKSLPGDRRRLP